MRYGNRAAEWFPVKANMVPDPKILISRAMCDDLARKHSKDAFALALMLLHELAHCANHACMLWSTTSNPPSYVLVGLCPYRKSLHSTWHLLELLLHCKHSLSLPRPSRARYTRCCRESCSLGMHRVHRKSLCSTKYLPELLLHCTRGLWLPRPQRGRSLAFSLANAFPLSTVLYRPR